MSIPAVRRRHGDPSSSESVSALRLRGVVKRFGSLTAVDHLDLDVPEGTCVGLLGPNGAGKSTTMKLLTAQALPDEGEIEILGHAVPRDSKAARAECGVVPQLDNLDTTLTVEQNLVVFAHLYRIARSERRAAVERALEIANLSDRRDTVVDKLSGGMRRRLLIARGLVHRPRLVLLDEPTVGSSRSSSRGRCTRARAMSSRRRIPPESLSTRVSRRSRRLARSSAQSIAARRSARGMR